MKYQPGQIVENVLSNGKVVVCRVIEALDFPGAENSYRVTDAQETESNPVLIKTNRTWAAPAENLRPHDKECYLCGHKNGLVTFR